MSIGEVDRNLLLSRISVNEIVRYNSIALHWTKRGSKKFQEDETSSTL